MIQVQVIIYPVWCYTGKDLAKVGPPFQIIFLLMWLKQPFEVVKPLLATNWTGHDATMIILKIDSDSVQNEQTCVVMEVNSNCFHP